MNNIRIHIYLILTMLLVGTISVSGQKSNAHQDIANKAPNADLIDKKKAYQKVVAGKDTVGIFKNAYQIVVHYNNDGNFDSSYFYNEVLISTALVAKDTNEYLLAQSANYFMDSQMHQNIDKADKRLKLLRPYLLASNTPLQRKYDIAEILARSKINKGDLDSTIYFSKMAVRLSNEIGVNHQYRVAAYAQLAVYLQPVGRYAEAIQYLTEVEPIIETDLNPPMRKINIYSTLCNSLVELNETEAAEYYLEKCKNLIKKYGYKSFDYKVLGLEGKIESAKGNVDLAIAKYQSALAVTNQGKFQSVKAPNWTVLGQLHASKNDFSGMKVYMDSLAANYSKIDDRFKAQYHGLLVRYHLAKDNLVTAKSSLDYLNIYNTKPTAERLPIAYLNYQYDQKTGNAKKELKSFRKYTLLKDSLKTLANAVLGKRIEAEYNREKQNIEIKGLTETTSAQNKALAIRNNALIMGGIMLLALALLFYFLYRLYRKNQSQTIKIGKALDENQTLLKEIHHRVRNNLQVISSLLSMQARKIDDRGMKDVLNSSRSRVQSMSILHQNLYSGANAKNVEVDDYFDLLLDNILATYNIEKKITFDINIDDIAFDIDVMVPLGLIANELITNALKYAFEGRAEGKLEVSLKEKGDQFIFIVSDDGVGFEGNELPLKEGSIGTRLIKSFTKKLKGTIEITHLIGTEIKITFDKEVLTN